MPLYRHAPQFAKPSPLHHTSPEAEAGRAGMAEWTVERHTHAELFDPVTQHPEPWRQIALDELTGAAAVFARKALAVGREVAARRAGETVCLGVRAVFPDPTAEVYDLSIRAYWKAGRTSGVVMGGRKVTVAEAVAAL